MYVAGKSIEAAESGDIKTHHAFFVSRKGGFSLVIAGSPLYLHKYTLSTHTK